MQNLHRALSVTHSQSDERCWVTRGSGLRYDIGGNAHQHNYDEPMSDTLPRRTAILLFAVVVFSWGITWPVTKAIVAQVPPLWTAAIRSAIAGVSLLCLLLPRGALIAPKPGDWPIVVNIALLHMVAFAALVAVGLQFISAGRSVVLGYTTPVWVVPGGVRRATYAAGVGEQPRRRRPKKIFSAGAGQRENISIGRALAQQVGA